MAQYPQFTDRRQPAARAAPAECAPAGCLLGVMPQARKAAEDGLESTIVGSKPAEQAMKDAAAGMQSAIQNYNKSVG